MAEYKVIYVINVDADTPKEAALQTEQILKDMSYRPYLSVQCPSGKIVNVDLEKEDVQTNKCIG